MLNFKQDGNAVFMYVDDEICGTFVGAYRDDEFRLGSVQLTPNASLELKKWLALQPQSTPPAQGKIPDKYEPLMWKGKHVGLINNYGVFVPTFETSQNDELLKEIWEYCKNESFISLRKEVVLPQSESEVIASLDIEPAPTGLNPDQTAIWNIYEAAKIKALKKNLAYGSSVFKKGVLTPELSADAAIRVRMSDKVGRLTTLLADPTKNQISDESIDDTVMDLATYSFLLLIARKRDLK